MFIPLRDDNKLQSISFQYVTIGLIVLNVLVFFVFEQGGATFAGDCALMALEKAYALIPIELDGTQVALPPVCGEVATASPPELVTLVSYMFLHGDVLHLFGNMLFLWVFGDNVEDAMGHGKYLVFYLLCGVLAGLTHAYISSSPQAPLVGASGAVAGVIAAYLMLHPRVMVWGLVFKIFPMPITAAVALGLWVVTQFVMVMLPSTDPTAWWAHIGGLIAGAILVVFFRRPGMPLFDKGLDDPAGLFRIGK